MGADMRSGQFELHGRRTCGLVSQWCSAYDYRYEFMTEDEWRDRLGLFDYPEDMVYQANHEIPVCYDAAHELGFPVDDRDTFSRARCFLQDAVTTGEGISGSY